MAAVVMQIGPPQWRMDVAGWGLPSVGELITTVFLSVRQLFAASEVAQICVMHELARWQHAAVQSILIWLNISCRALALHSVCRRWSSSVSTYHKQQV